MKLTIDIIYYLAYWLAGALGVAVGIYKEDIMIKRKEGFIQIKRIALIYTLLFCIAIAFSLSFVRDGISRRENNAQIDSTKSFFKAINDSNENRLSRVIISMKIENDTQSNLTRRENDQNRIVVIDSMVKTFNRGQKKNDKNADDIKKQIRDSLDRLVPDLYILSSYDKAYQETDDTDLSHFILGACNGGNGRALDVKFTYEIILRYSEPYSYLGHFYIYPKYSIFNDRKAEIEIGKCLTTKSTLNKYVIYDYSDVFLKIHITYTTYSKKPYSIDDVYVYTPLANKRFARYNGGVKDFDEFMKSH